MAFLWVGGVEGMEMGDIKRICPHFSIPLFTAALQVIFIRCLLM